MPPHSESFVACGPPPPTPTNKWYGIEYKHAHTCTCTHAHAHTHAHTHTHTCTYLLRVNAACTSSSPAAIILGVALTELCVRLELLRQLKASPRTG